MFWPLGLYQALIRDMSKLKSHMVSIYSCPPTSYQATPIKGHPSDETRFQMY